MTTPLRDAFNEWGKFTDGRFAGRQWLLAKWEVCEGVVWPEEKIDLMMRLIGERLQPGLNDIFADLGCGGGWMLKRLAPDTGFAVGLDFSAEMLWNATVAKAGDALLQGEIGRLPVRSGSLDRVLCYFVLINMIDDRQVEHCILDMWRTLKPGGRLLIGQLPDAAMSGLYDQAKTSYMEYCREEYSLGDDLRDINRMPQKLFNVPALLAFLAREGISYEKFPSFNPFYRPGEPVTVDWRFDLVLQR